MATFLENMKSTWQGRLILVVGRIVLILALLLVGLMVVNALDTGGL